MLQGGAIIIRPWQAVKSSRLWIANVVSATDMHRNSVGAGLDAGGQCLGPTFRQRGEGKIFTNLSGIAAKIFFALPVAIEMGRGANALDARPVFKVRFYDHARKQRKLSVKLCLRKLVDTAQILVECGGRCCINTNAIDNSM